MPLCCRVNAQWLQRNAGMWADLDKEKGFHSNKLTISCANLIFLPRYSPHMHHPHISPLPIYCTTQSPWHKYRMMYENIHTEHYTIRHTYVHIPCMRIQIFPLCECPHFQTRAQNHKAQVYVTFACIRIYCSLYTHQSTIARPTKPVTGERLH